MKNDLTIEVTARLTVDEITAKRALAIVNMYLEDTHRTPTLEVCNHGGECDYYRIKL